MDFSVLPPRHQLVEIMTRIYQQGLTTTSGGNLSILDDDGNLWITPAGIDKGSLLPEDIICIHPDQTIEGRHKPSSEYPFHRMIYAARPDLRALVHAHPPALVAFSVVRKIPDTRINPQSHRICGEVGYAPYALPGSENLGANIAQTFGKGFTAVLLENHGVVTGGSHLLDAFQRFETLEYCAQINIRARALGDYASLTDAQIDLFFDPNTDLPYFDPPHHTNRELELRLQMAKFVHRAYQRHLMISTGGTVSARIDDHTFLITPYGEDRNYLEPEDVVLIQDGHQERGKKASRAVGLHQAIYRQHPHIHCIMSAQPPHATTYSIAQQRFDTRTIPESYILLREMPIAPYGPQFSEPERIAALIQKDIPIILLQNDSILSTGATILETFDRLEVAEFTAQALIQTLSIGELVPISENEITNLKSRFPL